MSSIWIILALAISMNLDIDQLNMKIAFHHGDLEEGIYTEAKWIYS